LTYLNRLFEIIGKYLDIMGHPLPGITV